MRAPLPPVRHRAQPRGEFTLDCEGFDIPPEEARTMQSPKFGLTLCNRSAVPGLSDARALR